MPAGEGALGELQRNISARRKHLCGRRPERSFHAQGFGDGRGGSAVLAAVGVHAEIVAAGEGGGLRARSNGRPRWYFAERPVFCGKEDDLFRRLDSFILPMVPGAGIEPARPCEHEILSLLRMTHRLPIHSPRAIARLLMTIYKLDRRLRI